MNLDRAQSTSSTPRVVLLTTYYHPVIGGVESHARQIVSELHRRSFDIAVLTKQLERGMPVAETLDGVSVQRVPPAGRRTRFAKWLFLPFAFAALVRMRPRPQVIFCPDFRGIGIAAVAAARVIGCSVVLQAETPGALSCDSWDPDLVRWGIDPGGRLGRALKWPVRRVYASASAYTCISREIEAEARRCGVLPERLVYVPHAVDVSRFHPASVQERAAARAAVGVGHDRTVCLFVGRLSKEKGVLDLLEAWARLDRSGAVLVLVGPDMAGHPLDAGGEARRFAARQQLGDSVVFAGPTNDPAAVMHAGDVFVQPSHYEAFGISVIEAMASGLAPVATNVGGMKDFLIDDENALLCEPRDPRSLAHQLGRVLADPVLRERLGQRARATAVSQFDKDVVANVYAGVFSGLAPGQAGTGARV